MDLFTLDTYPSSLHLNEQINEKSNFNSDLVISTPSYPKESSYQKQGSYQKESNLNWEPYHIQDCLIKSGDCHFDLISEALKKSKNKISSKKLRKLLFDHLSVNDQEFKKSRDIKTKKQLKTYIDTFNGDNETLNILSKLLNIDFYVFENNSQLPIEIGQGNDNFIFLDTFSQGVIGLKITDKKHPQTFFNRNSLPFVLESLIDKNIYFKNKIIEFYNTVPKKNFTLINLYNYLGNLNTNDKKLVLGIIKDLVKTVKLNSHKIKYKIKDSPIKKSPIKKSDSPIKPKSLSKTSVYPIKPKSLSKKSVKKSYKSLSKKLQTKSLRKSLKKSVKKLLNKKFGKKSIHKSIHKSLKKMSIKKLKSLKKLVKRSKKNKKRKEKVKRSLKKRVLRPIKK